MLDQPAKFFGLSSLWAETVKSRGPRLIAVFRPELSELPALEERYQDGQRDARLIEELARRYAESGKFAQAVQVGLQRRWLPFATPQDKVAYDLEVSAWAEKNDDLVLAKWIYLRENDPEMIFYQQSIYVKPPYEAAYIALHREPKKWVESARRKLAAGDFLAAEQLLTQAERLNGFTVYQRKELKNGMHRLVISHPLSLGSLKNEKASDGSWNLVPTKETQDADPGILLEIEALRGEIHSFESGLKDLLQEEAVASLQEMANRATAGNQKKLVERSNEFDSLKVSFQQLEVLESGGEWKNAHVVLESLSQSAGKGDWNAVESAFFDLAHPIQKVLPWSPQDPEKAKVFQESAMEFLGLLSEALPMAQARNSAGLVVKLTAMRESLSRWEDSAEGGIQHLDASPLVRKARLHLAAGYFYGRSDLAEAGKRELAALQRYSEIEPRKNAAMLDLAKFYPEGSRLLFKTELTEQDKATCAYDMRPSPKLVEESRILKTLHRLETDDPALAALMKEVLADLRKTVHRHEHREVEPETGLTYDLGDEVTGYGESDGLSRDAGALEARVQALEKLYGHDDAEIVRFIREVQKDEHAELYEKNIGYRYQRDLEVNLARLKDFSINEAAFRTAREIGYVGVDANMAKALVAFLKNSGKLYEKFLEEEVARAREHDIQHYASGMGPGAALLGRGFNLLKYEYGLWMGTSPQVLDGLREDARTETEKAQSKLDEFRAEFKQVQDNLESIDASDLPKTFAALEQISKQEQTWAEAHSLAILKWEMAEVEKISSSAGSRMKPLLQELENTDPWSGNSVNTLEARLQAYLGLQQRVDFEVLRAEVSARISAYDEMSDEADLFDDIWNGIGNAGAWVASAVTDAEWDDFESTGNFEIMKRKYRELSTSLDQEGLPAVDGVKAKFQRLNAMAIHEELQDEYKDLTLSNRLSLGLAVTPFAAGAGALFAEGAALLGVGRLGVSFANALGFTLTARVLHGAAYHGLSGVGKAFTQIGNDPFAFVEETMLNWAMFGVLGKANQAFSKFFEGKVEGLIAARLVTRGKLSAGVTVTEEMLAKDAVLRAAYLEESAAVNGFKTEILRRGGTFADEAATFQG